MGKKLGKSVFTTGVAATTLFSGMLGHKAHAEELVQNENKDNQSTGISGNKPTLADVENLNDHVVEAESQVNSQRESLSQAQDEFNQAREDVQNAETGLEEAETNVEDATPNAIARAENDIKVAEAMVTIEEDKVRQASEAEDQLTAAIKEQENKVAAQQLLVDVAQNELNQAKQPTNNDEAVLANARAVVAQAKAELENAQAVLANLQAEQAKVPEVLSQANVEVGNAQARVTELSNQIAAKEATLNVAREVAAVSPGNLQQTTYESLLQEWANSGDSQAVQALALYRRGREEDQLSGGSSVTLDNNLRALEIVDAINQYRRQAGLPVLLVDPYQFPASQIQAEYFAANEAHMFKYQANENVAWGFTPQEAAAFWYSEKDLYQQVAAQYGLPTDETQLDANQIYMKVGADVFARIGHYVQMMGNQFNSVSVAYDPAHQISEAAFLNSSGQLFSTAELAQRLRSGANASTTTADVKALENEIATLRVERTNQASRIDILSARLQDVKNSVLNNEQVINQAKTKVQEALAKRQLATTQVAEAEESLAVSRARILSSVTPKEEALEKANQALASAQAHLLELQNQEKQTFAKVQAAQAELQKAKDRLTAAKERLDLLKNAPELLIRARAVMATAKANLEDKKDKLEKEFETFLAYQETATSLKAQFDDLVSRVDPAVLASSRFATEPVEKEQPAYQGQVSLVGVTTQATDPTSNKQEVASEQLKELPNTGSKSNGWSLAGFFLAILSFLGLGKKRKS